MTLLILLLMAWLLLDIRQQLTGSPDKVSRLEMMVIIGAIVAMFVINILVLLGG